MPAIAATVLAHSGAESHLAGRIGWLRAAILGANDGIISTSSLVLGVASGGASPATILLTGVAGMVGGALSMAAGEYVSVSSQGDLERADIERERQELASDPEGELEELTRIYQERGLDRELARQVARALTRHDALEAHTRDELGITDVAAARPLQAAGSSALAFVTGAAAPVLLATASPAAYVGPVVAAGGLAALFLLGSIGALAGGTSPWKPALRVAFWGAAAMGVTALIGGLVGTAI